MTKVTFVRGGEFDPLAGIRQPLADSWEHDGLQYGIVHSDSPIPGWPRHHCGYVAFPKRPVSEKGYGGLLTYVPVHGGITYAQEFTDGSMVYGFDCAHAGDESNPNTSDLTWLRSECLKLGLGVALAAEFEVAYGYAALDLSEDGTNDTRGAIIEAYHQRLTKDYGIQFDLMNNMGAQIGVLTGRL